jgi:anti-sigma regulatory factor (Ser/Thr protein kinase)
MGAMLVRHEPTSAAIVRRTIAAELGARGFDRECIEDAVLVASELVGNAVKHVDPTTQAPDGDLELDISWSIADAHVVLSVIDVGDAEPHARTAGPYETSGRGMAIIEALSAAWGVDRLPGGKRVWARLPLR